MDPAGPRLSFRSPGVRYHEGIRLALQVTLAGWSALIEHADAINFFDRSKPAPVGLSDCIFHLAITAGNRSRELAIDDPFETSELAYLITLTRRAMCDRQVLLSNMFDKRPLSRPRSATFD